MESLYIYRWMQLWRRADADTDAGCGDGSWVTPWYYIKLFGSVEPMIIFLFFLIIVLVKLVMRGQ